MFSWPKTFVIAAVAACGLTATADGAAAAPACPSAGFTVAEPMASKDTRPVKDGAHHTIFVRRDPITTTADIADANLAGDDFDTQVLLKLKPDAAERLHDATANRAGLRLAFVADDQVLMLVTWEGPYGMDANLGLQLSLPHGMARARPLVEAIRTCIGEPLR